MDTQVYEHLDEISLQSLINDHGVTHVILASTGVEIALENVRAPGVLLKLSSMTPVPIEVRYKSPETLGQDRLAGMVAASWLYPGSNVLVIDASVAMKWVVDGAGLTTPLNEGYRNMIVASGSLFIGATNGANLSPEGGWELIRLGAAGGP